MAVLNIDITTSVNLKISSIVSDPAFVDVGGSGQTGLEVAMDEALSVYFSDQVFNKVFADRVTNDPAPVGFSTAEEHLFIACLVSYRLCKAALDTIKNGGIKRAKADVVETEFFGDSFNAIQTVCDTIAGDLSRLACKLEIADYCGIGQMTGYPPSPIIIYNDDED